MSELKRHQCRHQGPGIQVEYSKYGPDDRWAWRLVVTLEAAEADMETNPNLEEVGQELWSMMVEINHCPFCGERFRDMPLEEIDFGLFDSFGAEVRSI